MLDKRVMDILSLMLKDYKKEEIIRQISKALGVSPSSYYIRGISLKSERASFTILDEMDEYLAPAAALMPKQIDSVILDQMDSWTETRNG